MKLSKLSYAVVVASLMAAGAAQAAVKTSGSVAFTTDYKFRGISQTSANAAVQGSLTATHDSGAYATVWGSSVDSLTGGSEMDFLLGYSAAAGDITYDVGVMRYSYPGATAKNYGTKPDYNEVYASASGGTPDYDYIWEDLTTGATTTNTTWGGRNPYRCHDRVYFSRLCSSDLRK